LYALGLVLLVACGEPPLTAEVSLVSQDLAVHASASLDRVDVTDAKGVPLVRRRLPAPVDELVVEVPWTGRAPYRIRLVSGSQELILALAEGPVLGAFEATLQAPVGQGSRLLSDGAQERTLVVGSGGLQVALSVRVSQPGPVLLSLGQEVLRRESTTAGERIVLLTTVSGPVIGLVEHGLERLEFTLTPERISVEQARRSLVLERVAFPAEGSGRPDPARPVGRVTLPSDWWLAVLRHTALGFRPRDEEIPWAWQGVTLRNDSERALNVVIRARVVGADGLPDPAFRPRVREQDDGTGTTSVLLRVPAGRSATGALPVYVDDSQLGPGPWTRQIEVWPIGSTEHLVRWEAPLYVSRGSKLLGATFALGLFMAGCGGVLLWRRLAVWLQEIPTSQLMTIALFGSLSFMVAAFGRLFGVSLASVLGPFSSLVTGIVDDAFRITLLATLISLCPRPGVAALAVLVEWLLGGLTLGAVSPVDLLFVGNRVAWLEGGLFLAGITAGRGWLGESSLRRWGRLALALGLGGLGASATALALNMVLYRLFYADWYIAMVLALPGFLYVLVACAIAVPFADALRQVAP
jgi:hypothetical protein